MAGQCCACDGWVCRKGWVGALAMLNYMHGQDGDHVYCLWYRLLLLMICERWKPLK